MSVSMAVVGSIKPQWTPSELGSTSLALWLDAAASTTFSYSSGSIVSTWGDRSGNSRDLSNNNTGSQPERVTNVQNGNAVVRFTSDYLRRSGNVVTSSPYTYFIAFKSVTAGSGVIFRLIGDNTNAYKGLVDLSGNFAAFAMYSGSAVYRGTLDTNWHVLMATFDGTNSSLWIDGSQSGATGNPGTGTPTGLIIGALGDPLGQYLNTDYGEVLVLAGSLSSANRQRIEGYLCWKWGLSGNLASNHPYKSLAP